MTIIDKNVKRLNRVFWHFLSIVILMLIFSNKAFSQYCICTKTVSQLSEGPAKAHNSAIDNLAFTPKLSRVILARVSGKTKKKLNIK